MATRDEIEAAALRVEVRILEAGAIPPLRQHGRPINATEILRDSRIRALLELRDPSLILELLGCN